jgi:thymidine phosphorylase
MAQQDNILCLSRLGIDTYKEAVIYMREDSHVCRSEGLTSHARVRVALDSRYIIATLHIIKSDMLKKGHASLSEYAWDMLGAHEKDLVTVSHAKQVSSLSHVRSKIYGNSLSADNIHEIIEVLAG